MTEKKLTANLDGILIHCYKIKVDGIKKKVIYHFSDTHLCEHDSLSDKEEVARATERAEEWERTRREFAERHGEPCSSLQQKDAREHFSNLLKVAGDGDAVIIAGDILDYVSDANIRAVDSELSKCKMPYLAVCGNHDKASEIPDECLLSDMKKRVQLLDLGDLLIVGIDNSEKQITKEQNEELINALATKKPITVVMHVPIMTEGNASQLKEYGDYFQLNHKGATEETQRFIEILKNNSKQIIAVLAGHFHFESNSEITEGLMQYVSSQGILGNINRYEIGS